jgi:predicted nuclease with TOPRIM domain
LTFTKEETAIIDSLNEIDVTLNKAVKRVSAIESERIGIENELKVTTEKSEELKNGFKPTKKICPVDWSLFTNSIVRAKFRSLYRPNL